MRKNIIYFALLALAALGFASCSSDTDTAPVASPDEVLTPIRISAVYEGSATTRVAYTEDGSNITAQWQDGDELYVFYNGHVNTLSLTSGAGDVTATFTGTIQGTPSASSILACYVRDANTPSAISVNVDNGKYTYADGTFLSQDGTLGGAAKCNVYSGYTTYGTGENLSCSFSVNTSILKFRVYAPKGVSAGDDAALTYKTGDTELAKASFTVGKDGKNDIYMTVPAGQYTGEQTVTFKNGSAEESMTLSATKASFIAGNTYSRTLDYLERIDLSMLDCAGQARDSRWTANCYMVHTAGNYKLPLVYGNGIKKGVANSAAYIGVSGQLEQFLRHDGEPIIDSWIKDNGITVTSAELLWQDAQGLITAVDIIGDYLTLTVGKGAAEQEGNAVIAAKTIDGTIVWSWHIWVTKQTFSTLTTVHTGSHDYQVTPVNLGWVATGGDGKRGYGTFYQWGRKDAFIPSDGATFRSPYANHTVYDISGSTVTGITFEESTTATIADNIKNPTTFYYNSNNEGPCNTTYYNMWDAQNTAVDNVTTATQKTVYDPCPPGFCVPTGNLYYYIGNGNGNGDATPDDLDYFIANRGRILTSVTHRVSDDVFFPASGNRGRKDGRVDYVGVHGWYWSASGTDRFDEAARGLHFTWDSWDWKSELRATALPIRPVEEE